MELIFAIIAFGIISVASNQISKLFQKIKLPVITGFLIIGIITGPFILEFIKTETIGKLNFINEISLAFIAYAAGTELYLKNLRTRFKSIRWMTFGQFVVTFVVSTVVILLISDYVSFMRDLNFETKLSMSLLAATIFVARSPSSAIAVISEMRAKGPFTQTVMGVTVIKDVLVIILFAIVFSLSKTLISGVDFNYIDILIILLELALSVGLGYVLYKLIGFVLSFQIKIIYKIIIVLLLGYGVYLFSDLVKVFSEEYLSFEIYVEPLLINIIASFLLTNYNKYKTEFHRIIRDAEPYVYIVFFTLTGASVSLDILLKSWFIALIFFAIRFITIILGAYIGGKGSGDPAKLQKFGWMPYITQAGVALGLVTVVVGEFPVWGQEFATILISVIVLNQIVGPPLFKWVLSYVGESHKKAKVEEFDGLRDAIIFGLEGQSVALAKMLKSHNWEVKIATRQQDIIDEDCKDIEIVAIDKLSIESLKKMQIKDTEAVVLMCDDDENLLICELVYEHFGVSNVIVRLNDYANIKKFDELGALVVHPATSMVGLLDHFVRSPQATSLILGMEENQDTQDIEILNKGIHGIALRDLRLPLDVLILSISRKDQFIMPHGYTRIRLHDIVTIVGDNESLEKVRLKLQ